MTTQYYVYASISDDGNFAKCTYYYDKAGTEAVGGTQLSVPVGAPAGFIEQTDKSPLVLIGASYKTLGQVPAMNLSNFAPADDQNSVRIEMPVNAPGTTKGIVLLFSNKGAVDNLYASPDPQMTNDVKDDRR